VGVEEPFNANISSITKKATTDLDRDAREVTEPIRAVRDDVLEAAGIKLHGCPAKTMRSQARGNVRSEGTHAQIPMLLSR
jgi:hypothetical protein